MSEGQSQIHQVQLSAGLNVTRFEQGRAITDTVVSSGQITVNVQDSHIVNDSVIEEIAQIMQEVAEKHVSDQLYSWVLYTSYDGRCWYIEGFKDTQVVDMGYLLFDDIDEAMSVLAKGDQKRSTARVEAQKNK